MESAERTCIPEFGFCAPSDQKNRFCDLAPAGVTVWAEIGRLENRFFSFFGSRRQNFIGQIFTKWPHHLCGKIPSFFFLRAKIDRARSKQPPPKYNNPIIIKTDILLFIFLLQARSAWRAPKARARRPFNIYYVYICLNALREGGGPPLIFEICLFHPEMWSITRENEICSFVSEKKSDFLPLCHRFRMYIWEKARPLLSKTRFFSLRWPEVARIDIFEFLLHKHWMFAGLKPPQKTWVLILAARGSKNRSPNEYVFLGSWVSNRFFDISGFLKVTNKQCRVLGP